VRSARPGPEGGEAGKLIAWGPGPRASQSLMLAVRARALLDGLWHPRSTMYSISPSRFLSTAWRSHLPRAPKAAPFPM